MRKLNIYKAFLSVLLFNFSSLALAEVVCNYRVSESSKIISKEKANTSNQSTVRLNGWKWDFCTFSKMNFYEVDSEIKEIGKRQYLGFNVLCSTKDGTAASMNTGVEISKKLDHSFSYLKLTDEILDHDGVNNKTYVTPRSKEYEISISCLNY